LHGLKVCLAATESLNLRVKIEHIGKKWFIQIWTNGAFGESLIVENEDLLSAWLEALCRARFPEKFEA